MAAFKNDSKNVCLLLYAIWYIRTQKKNKKYQQQQQHRIRSLNKRTKRDSVNQMFKCRRYCDTQAKPKRGFVIHSIRLFLDMIKEKKRKKKLWMLLKWNTTTMIYQWCAKWICTILASLFHSLSKISSWRWQFFGWKITVITRLSALLPSFR